MSIFPSIQEMLMAPEVPQESGSTGRFRRRDRATVADPGLRACLRAGWHETADFITYGVTQRTLSQFIESAGNPWRTCDSDRFRFRVGCQAD